MLPLQGKERSIICQLQIMQRGPVGLQHLGRAGPNMQVLTACEHLFLLLLLRQHLLLLVCQVQAALQQLQLSFALPAHLQAALQ